MKTKTILARHVSPLKSIVSSLKIGMTLMTSVFSLTKISHVLEELKRDLRAFMKIERNGVPKKGYIYFLVSKFSLNQFINMILRILNSVCKKRARNSQIIGDCNDIRLDINHFRKPVITERS